MKKVTNAFMVAALLFGGGSLIYSSDVHAQAGSTVGQLRGQIRDKAENGVAGWTPTSVGGYDPVSTARRSTGNASYRLAAGSVGGGRGCGGAGPRVESHQLRLARRAK